MVVDKVNVNNSKLLVICVVGEKYLSLVRLHRLDVMVVAYVYEVTLKNNIN